VKTEVHQAASAALWKAVRNRVRAPLYVLISYAEQIADQEGEPALPPLDALLDRLLRLCELLLQQTAWQPPAAQTAGEDVVAARFREILAHRSAFHEIAQELEAIPQSGPSDYLGHLTLAAAAFEEVLATLAEAPARRNTALPRPALHPHSQPSGGPSGAALIVDVEYRGLLLVVDDDEGNRDVLSRRLLRDGYEVMLAESGRQALRMLRRYSFDLVLLDIMMPGMDGISVLAEMKHDDRLRHLPVIMITAVDEIETIAHCIENGADDYMFKPFNPVLLRARTHALLDRKRLQDEQQRQHAALHAASEDSRRQAERARQMLLNILPASIADELIETGAIKPMYFEDVTIVFADIVGFTASTEQLPAEDLVDLLNEHFTLCDRIVERYGLEKLKTIGDCYMFVGGIPTRSPSHPVDCVLAALEMAAAMDALRQSRNVDWQLRIGINTGPVIAGVVGVHKFAFDIWGDSVNFASRIEECGAPQRVNLAPATFTRVKDFFRCEKRNAVRVREGRHVDMFFVEGIARGFEGRTDQSSLDAFRARYLTYFRKPLQAYPGFVFELS